MLEIMSFPSREMNYQLNMNWIWIWIWNPCRANGQQQGIYVRKVRQPRGVALLCPASTM